MINSFSDTIKEIFSIAQIVLPREIKNVILPFLTILVAVIVYKLVRKVLI